MRFFKPQAAHATLMGLFLLASAPATVRADEPYYLRIEPGGHTAEVRKVLFTSDGSRLISVGRDKAVRIWDLKTSRQVDTLRGWIGPDYTGEIYAAALNSNGKLLAIGGQDLFTEGRSTVGYIPSSARGEGCDIRVFDLAGRNIVRALKGHKNAITSLAFSREDLLASASTDDTVRLWSSSGNLLHVFSDSKKEVYGVAFSPDGLSLASASYDGRVRVYEVGTGKLQRTLDCGKPVQCVDWSPDGIYLAAGAQDHRVHLWDAHSYADLDPQAALTQKDNVTCLAFGGPGGHLLLTGSGETERLDDLTVRLWSVPDDKLLQTFTKHTGTIFTVAFSQDGLHAASADESGAIYVWNPVTGAEEARLAGTGASVYAVAWSPDGKRVAWGNTAGHGAPAPLEQVFDLSAPLPAPSEKPDATWRRAQMDLNGSQLSIPDDGSEVTLTAGNRVRHIKSEYPGDRIYCCSFVTPDQIVVGSAFGLAIYDSSGKPVRRYVSHEGAVLAVSVSPDGKYLASASADQTVRIWNLAGKEGTVFGIKNAVLPLLSLFRGIDREWIAWTPQGYYASSPAGDDIVGWQRNMGRDRAAEFYRAAQLRYRFNRPDAVRLVLDKGSVEAALLAAGPTTLVEPTAPLLDLATNNVVPIPPPPGQTYTPPILVIPADPAVTVPQTLPKIPVVEIVGVQGAHKQGDSYIADQQNIAIHVRVTNAEMDHVTLKLNVNTRNPQERGLVKDPVAPNERSLVASLQPGENLIQVIATTYDAGDSLPAQVMVTWTAPVTVDARPSLYMISIGVSQYQDRSIESLHFATDDALQMAQFYRMQENKLFKKVSLATLTDADATVRNFTSALDTIGKSARPEDCVIIFVASHGLDLQKESQFCLALSDTRLASLETTTMPGDQLLNDLAKLPCTVLLLLDTCQSATIDDENAMDNLIHQSRHLFYTFAACKSGESSHENEAWKCNNDPSGGHGAFTKALLDALRNPQNPDADNGQLKLFALEYQIERAVPKMVSDIFPGQSQDPILYGRGKQDPYFIIAQLR